MTYGPYTPIRQAGNQYFVSGQVGVHTDTKLAGADIHSQTTRALDNLRAILVEAGLTLQDVVKTTVFLKNMDDFTVMNDIFLFYFEAPRPARSCVEVAGLPRVADNELLVEIEAIAYKQVLWHED